MKRVRAEVLTRASASARTTRSRSSRPRSPNASAPGSSSRSRCPRAATFLLRRHFSIHQASRRGGWAGTLEFVFDPRGPGIELARGGQGAPVPRRDRPARQGLRVPAKLSTCLLVAEGHGSAPIYFLAQELRARGKRVDMLVGAETQELVFKPIEAKRLSQTIVDRDGGREPRRDRRRRADLLPQVVESTGAQVIYAAAPRRTLRTRRGVLLASGRSPRRSRSRRRWRAGSACASRAPCR